jgi:hypothetical protein
VHWSCDVCSEHNRTKNIYTEDVTLFRKERMINLIMGLVKEKEVDNVLSTTFIICWLAGPSVYAFEILMRMIVYLGKYENFMG